MKVSLKSITPDAEVLLVEIARVSSNRIDKTEKPEGLINYLIKNKHWSPFEHGHLTFEVETSISIAVQYLRHVSLRFQQFSQRYAVSEGMEQIEFRLQADKNRQSSTDVVGIITGEPGSIYSVVDQDYTNNNSGNQLPARFSDLFAEIAYHLDESFKFYNKLLEMGIAKETARFVLPLATRTKLYMTGNIRSWIHLLDIRADDHAQKEARLIAKEIKQIFIKQCPIISKALNYGN